MLSFVQITVKARVHGNLGYVAIGEPHFSKESCDNFPLSSTKGNSLFRRDFYTSLPCTALIWTVLHCTVSCRTVLYHTINQSINRLLIHIIKRPGVRDSLKRARVTVLSYRIVHLCTSGTVFAYNSPRYNVLWFFLWFLVLHSFIFFVFDRFLAVCNMTFTDSSGYITSPYYPGDSPSSFHCTWRILLPPHHIVRLDILAFDLVEHPKCQDDFLKIKDGVYSSSPSLGVFCGSQVPTVIDSSSNEVEIEYKSRSPKSRFKILYSARKREWRRTTAGTAQGERLRSLAPLLGNSVQFFFSEYGWFSLRMYPIQTTKRSEKRTAFAKLGPRTPLAPDVRVKTPHLRTGPAATVIDGWLNHRLKGLFLS